MYDLKRIEEKFHEFLGSDCEGFYRLEDLRITEELFKRGESVLIPFGFMKYSLKVENGEAVLRVRLVSRMDVDEICFIYEDEIRRCDLFDVYGDERRRKIESVKRKPADCATMDFTFVPNAEQEVFDFHCMGHMGKSMEPIIHLSFHVEKLRMSLNFSSKIGSFFKW